MFNPNWKQLLGAMLKMKREAENLNLRELASQLGLSASTLSRVENSEGCDVETLAKVCSYLGLSMDMLVKSTPTTLRNEHGLTLLEQVQVALHVDGKLSRDQIGAVMTFIQMLKQGIDLNYLP